MTKEFQPFLLRRALRVGLAALCAVLLLPGDATMWAAPPAPPSAAQDQESKIPPNQLDSLVAPIALYPDPLLAQILAASTYPLEIIQLQQWLTANAGLKDKALADAVAKQDWDPSVQGLAGLPDVVKNLAGDIKWTTDLGNAFLSQQSDVMDAVQRMRAKANEKGTLKSNEQMKVETKVVESKQVIVIEQANPQVVYVPSYDPVVVYGAPAYPYPSPWYYGAGMALSFGVGVAMGAMWSGGWGYNSGWGGNNNININNNNNFNRNSNINGGNRTNISGGRGNNSSWQHNSKHRGGTPYSNRGTADRFGGTTRGSSQAARQASARQQAGRAQRSGNFGGATGGRGGGAGAGGNRGGAGRGGAGAGGNRGGAGRGGAGAGGNRGGAGGGGDRVGNRSVSGSRGSSANGFGGSGRNSSGSGARASSSRGGSSMGGSRGGGGRSGGGGRGRR